MRLAGADDEALSAWARERAARDAILAENRRAARTPSLDPTDPRWVLAVRVQQALQGSVLTPDRRAKLHREAKRMGIQTFDATMVMAIVQDRARRGQSIQDEDVTLQLLAVAEDSRAARRTTRHLAHGGDIDTEAPSTWWRWALAFLCAFTANAFLIWWLGLFGTRAGG